MADERLKRLTRAILRAGAFELLVHVDTHPRIVISEYVDVSHAFFAGREPAMVNGVLDKLARAIRPDDLVARTLACPGRRRRKRRRIRPDRPLSEAAGGGLSRRARPDRRCGRVRYSG